ncbi:MAG: Spx/MgsR family RNA polymerase-binding regulatory protein [Sphingobacteriaceae bacterium]|jgi:arsenate reductase
MKVYGIKNCSTVKKALTWLDTHQMEYEFHDFKKLGIERSRLEIWVNKLGLDKLINKRGTTWRTLSSDLQRSAAESEAAAIQLMKDYPSVIKRPVIELAEKIILGFDAEVYEKVFQS